MVGSIAGSELSVRQSLLNKPKGSSLVEQILSENKDALLQASTTNPFLSALADGKLPAKNLMRFLAQRRLEIRLGWIKLLGFALTKVTTIDERNWPHEQDSFDILCEAIPTSQGISDFLGHIMLELEDDEDVGQCDINIGHGNVKAGQPNSDTASAIEFLIAAGANGTVPECLFVVWAMAMTAHEGYSSVKYKMMKNGGFPDSEPQTPSDAHRSHYFPSDLGVKEDLPRKQDKASAGLEGLFDSSLTPQQKLVAHWTSERMTMFLDSLAANIEGYVDLGIFHKELADVLFKRAVKLQSNCWPKNWQQEA